MTLAELKLLMPVGSTWQQMVASLPPSDLNLTPAQVAAKVLAAQGEINRIDGSIGWLSGSAEAAANYERLYWETRIHALQYANSAAWAARYDIAAIDNPDFISRAGSAVVSVVPIALQVAAIVAGADLVMGGALIAGGATTATAAGSTAASGALETGVTSAMEAAAQVSAAASPGVASAASAIAEMNAASWATLSTGVAQEIATTSLLSDLVQNAPAPKSPAPTPAPTMPTLQSPVVDSVIKSGADTAIKVGTVGMTAVLNKAIFPDPKKQVANAPNPTKGGTDGSLIAGALAVAGLLVYMAV